MYRTIMRLLLVLAMTVWLLPTEATAWSLFPSSKQEAYPSDNLWDVIRENFQLADNTDEPDVQQQIRWYQRHKQHFYRIAKKAEPYLYYIHKEVRQRGMPAEVVLVPMIESAYNPFQYSRVGAAGLWQIMPGTGSGLGLQIDWWYDGRRDVVESTKAALDYFGYLNHFFDGDWLLSIAAYDSGEGTVQHAIEHNAQRNQDVDFWSLPLPRETRNYVPRLLALVEIVKNPEHYGMKLPYIANKPYFGQVDIGYQMDLSAAAKLAEITLSELYQLNPGYNRWATAPNGPYNLVLPVNRVGTFKNHLADLPKHPAVSWQRHRVRAGDSLGTIAEHYKTTVALLKTVNGLTSNRIRLGKVLLIPGSSKTLNTAIISSRQRAIRAFHLKRLGPHKVDYVVKHNDTLQRIAHLYKVRTGALRFWNHLRYGEQLVPGEKLIIWTPLTSYQLTREAVIHYRVHHGESLSSIAHKFHVTLYELKNWNRRFRNKLLHPGDNLVIRHHQDHQSA